MTGKLYWTTDERTTDIPGLYEVNITTGKADLVTLYPDGEHVSSLYIPAPTTSPTSHLSQVLQPTSAEQPQRAHSAPQLPPPTSQATPSAATLQWPDISTACWCSRHLPIPARQSASPSLAQGPHTFEAVATHPTAGRSERASISFYVGYDGPAAVTDLTVSRVDDTHAKITWETPLQAPTAAQSTLRSCSIRLYACPTAYS